MSRYFMIQSWVGSHENEPDYNGQQAGERNVRSVEVVPLYDRYGNANTAAFSDEALAKRRSTGKKPKKASEQLDLADRHYERMEKMSQELDDEYAEGGLDEDRYELLRCKMDERIIKAWRRLEKENTPIWQKQDARQGYKAAEEPLEDDPVGWLGGGHLRSSSSLKSLDNSHENNDLLWLTGSVLGCILLLWMSN